MKKLLLFLMGILWALPGFAQQVFTYEYEGQTIRYDVSDFEAKTCYVYNNPEITGVVILPAHPVCEGVEYTLITIGDSAFSGCNSLTSVEIPNSVTTIGVQAFYGCSSLTSVEIPNSVTTIRDFSFSDCTGLTSVKIPNSVATIGNRAFFGCKSLMSVVLPNSITTIGDGTFEWCFSLTEVVIPNSVTSIGNAAFNGCNSLTAIEIPNSVKTIERDAFQSTILSSVLIPPSVKSVGVNAFYTYHGHTLQKIIFPNTLSYEDFWEGEIPNWQTPIIFPYDPEDALIKENVLYSKDGKKLLAYAGKGNEFTIPEGVTVIGKEAFAGSELKELTIPASLEEIEESAFWIGAIMVSPIEKTFFADWEKWYNDVKLGNVYSNPYRNGGAFVSGLKFPAPELKEGMTEIPDYKNLGLTPYEGEIELPSTLKKIGAYAFFENKEIYNIILPEYLETIGDYAFAGCELLENPSFPESLKEIGDGAFAGCISLTEISLPTGLTKLGNPKLGVDQMYDYRLYNNGNYDYTNTIYPYRGVFDHCYALEKAVISTDTDYLGDYLFNECRSLNKVYLPLSLKTIGDYSFYRCFSLDEITFPATLESIGMYGFAQGDYPGSLSKITIPNSVQTIGSHAFENQNISMLSIGSGVETIEEGVFNRNPLRVVEFSEGLKEIKTNAFANTGEYGINSLVLPSSLELIKEYAFSNTHIAEMVIPDGIKELPTGSCGSPRLLTIGSGVKTLAADAFSFNNLRTLRVKTTTPPSLSEAFNITTDQNDQLTLVVNNGRKTAFSTNARWKQIDRIIEESSTDVTIYMTGEYSISEEIRTTTGLMPSTVSKMKVVGPLTSKDFQLIRENMASLQELDLSQATGFTSIPGYQFSGSLLREIVLPDNIETIEAGAFENCPLLILEELPETIREIHANAFSNSPRISISRLPSALTTIESYAFSGCTGIRSMTGNNNLELIWGYGVFSDCSLMEVCDLSETKITDIPEHTFENCHALEEVILPESVSSIGDYAFSGTALRDIDFATNVTGIGSGAFSNCRRLVSANIPKGMEYLPSNIFSNCPRLIAASLPSGMKSVGTSLFNGDQKLANISSPAAEAPAAESGAFDGIRIRYVSLTVPGMKFREYLNAFGWGKFESIQNKIPLTIDDGVDVSNISETEYQDMLREDALEEAQRESSTEPALLSRSMERRSLQTRAAAEGRIFASLFDGAQIQTGSEGDGTRIFINPKPGVEVTSIKYAGKEMISEYKDNSILLPPNTQGSLEIKTSEGKSSVDKVPVQEFDGPVEVFDLNGMKVAESVDNLAKGIYIVRQGSKVKKIVVK